MPKMTSKQRRELEMDLRSNDLDRDSLMRKYGISDRALRTYRARLGHTAKVGRPHKPVDVINQEPAAIEPVAEDEIMTPDKNIETNGELPPLHDKPTKAIEPDPSKDYCLECYTTSKKLVEVSKNATSCPGCGIPLRWN